MRNRKMGTSPEKVYQGARYAIILLVALTVVNIILCMLNSDHYFVSSVFMSYFVVVMLNHTAVSIAIAALILVPYVLAFFLSKKKPVWMIVALVLFVIDTLFIIAVMFWMKKLGVSPWSMILDLALHALVIYELAMGVKYRDAAMESKTQEEGTEAPAMPTDEDGTYEEVDCVVTLSKENGKKTIAANGVARFYDNEVVIGTIGTAQQFFVGNAFISPSERMRFTYPEIVRAYYTTKKERTLQIDLADGRFVLFTLAGASREQLAAALYAHGVSVEPFAE